MLVILPPLPPPRSLACTGLHHAGRSWLPALWRTKPGRHPLHQAWGTLNVIVASVCGALTVEAAYRDSLPLQHWSVGGSVQGAPLLLPLRVPLTGAETGTPLVVDLPSHVVHVAFWVVVMFLYGAWSLAAARQATCPARGTDTASLGAESVTEYYWHRMMHLTWCYKTCHRYHHFYKAPEPFDDMVRARAHAAFGTSLTKAYRRSRTAVHPPP